MRPPCTPLSFPLTTVHSSPLAGESRWEEEDDEEDEDGDGGNGRGPGSGDDSPAGQRRIPGIDMSSLD